MISHMGIPGLLKPNALNLSPLQSQSNIAFTKKSISKSSHVTALISYHCLNNNPELHKIHNKEHKIKTMVNIAHQSMLHNLSVTSINNANTDTLLYDKFMEELQEE